MAVLAEENRLPRPKSIMPVQPFIRSDTMMKNFYAIPATTLLLVFVGENDIIVENHSAKVIFSYSDQIPFDQKDFIVQRTDQYESPALVADHFAPISIPNSSWIDAMYYYSTWRLFDALTDYAFYGPNHEFCLSNTPGTTIYGVLE